MPGRLSRFTASSRISLKSAVKHVIHFTISDRFAKIDLPSHSIEDNRYIWGTWDWSQKGSEWTARASDPELWLKSILDNMLYKYMGEGKEILEIGPGAGRWTEYLQPIAKRLVLVDITPKCIALCKERFAGSDNMEYHVIDSNIDFIPNNSLDRVWSYDVFVHINPSDIRRYIKNISRVLRPGGIAVIHHGSWGDYNGKPPGFRSRITAADVAQYIRESGLELVEQNRALVHKQGDVITVFQKGDSQ